MGEEGRSSGRGAGAGGPAGGSGVGWGTLGGGSSVKPGEGSTREKERVSFLAEHHHRFATGKNLASLPGESTPQLPSLLSSLQTLLPSQNF